MQTVLRESRSVLTPQKGGFLSAPPYPFTHTFSPFTGCGFGNTACGQYCYAQFMPNWTNFNGGSAWGELVAVKTNAPAILSETLAKMKPAERARLRIFMASTTDPYQPLEAKHEITRGCLDVFKQYPDLDLLVIQTRSPLVARDFDRIAALPYAWLSMTIETDDQAVIQKLGGGPLVQKRFEVVREATHAGIRTQIVVSPCLPYTPAFAQKLAESGATRIVVDDFIAGDGSGGKRTANSPFAAVATYDWRDSQPAHRLHDALQTLGVDVAWSATGFCGIPPRQPVSNENGETQPALI
jgi:DNA repair photolyase